MCFTRTACCWGKDKAQGQGEESRRQVSFPGHLGHVGLRVLFRPPRESAQNAAMLWAVV